MPSIVHHSDSVPELDRKKESSLGWTLSLQHFPSLSSADSVSEVAVYTLRSLLLEVVIQVIMSSLTMSEVE